eukprot:531650-Amphidinium_carterae.1
MAMIQERLALPSLRSQHVLEPLVWQRSWILPGDSPVVLFPGRATPQSGLGSPQGLPKTGVSVVKDSMPPQLP